MSYYTFYIGDVTLTVGWQDLLGLVLLALVTKALLLLRRARAHGPASPILPARTSIAAAPEKEPKALRYGSGKAEGGAWNATGPGYLPDLDPLHDFDLSTATLRDYVYVNKVLRYPYFQVCPTPYVADCLLRQDLWGVRSIDTFCRMVVSPTRS